MQLRLLARTTQHHPCALGTADCHHRLRQHAHRLLHRPAEETQPRQEVDLRKPTGHILAAHVQQPTVILRCYTSELSKAVQH